MHCYFCQKNIKEIDFKNARTLENFISAAGKIKSRKKTGLCSRHQRRLSQSIKRARFLALLPYIKK
jgi:small subunit ribosomal protein S18